ncbi:MAG TPA: EamA family transporter, partial [Candidatus Limnocylindria bacterium]|nr:EamA family transporter [Candidatus Limnocylindria bacterium]
YLVLSTCVGFVTIVYLIIRWSPSAASYGAVLGPIVTVILATLLAGEVFGPGFFVGAAIVGIGVYLGALSAATAGSPRPAASPAK